MVDSSAMRLTTWAALHAHAAAAFGRAIRTREDAIEVTVTLPPTPTEPATAVVVELRRRAGDAWLTVSAIIGSLRHQSPAAVLAASGRGAIGAYGTRDGQLAVRQALPLVGLRPADLDEVVRAIVQLVAAGRARAASLGV
ncbi:MAG: hypothetical protein K8W52_11485 [Deltaproteobacteria bacterium]|nr:hypothetical protein [Deltaproteobacteria bacterium]